jgi:antitoxin component YwqK of YwqJK toxin-antitoxin module
MTEPPAEPKEEVSRDDRGRLRERKFTLRGKIKGEYLSWYENGGTHENETYVNGLLQVMIQDQARPRIRLAGKSY